MIAKDNLFEYDRKSILVWITLIWLGLITVTFADTVAYWRFEEGVDGGTVPGTAGKTFYQSGVMDSSPNGNVLCAWDSTYSSQQYRAIVAQSIVFATGQNNFLSLKGSKYAQVSHRYSFNVNGQAEDSIGNADLTLIGNATVAGGVLDLPGGGIRSHNASALGAALTELAGTIRGADAITMEAWFNQDTASNWSKLMMLGQGTGNHYMDMTPRRGSSPYVSSCSINNGTDEIHAASPDGNQLVNDTEYYIAAIWNERADLLTIVVAKAGDPAGAVYGSVSMGGKDLASVIINEFHLGSAVQFGDQDFNGQINEFRIYRSALDSSQIYANIAAGPDTLVTVNDSAHLFTWSSQSLPSGTDLQTITPFEWTIEATMKTDGIGDFQTFVGREGSNVASENSALAPLYFQIVPDGRVQIAFADFDRNFHRLYSQTTVQAETWYHVAAVSDGLTLKLFINNHLDNTLSLGAGNAALAKTSNTAGWTLFCGMYESMITDYFDGLIDEVRISDAALLPENFLFWQSLGDLVIDKTDIVVSEQGPASRQITLALASEPSADVTVTLDDQAVVDQVVFDNNQLVFTGANWSIPRAVNVTAIDDDDFEALNHPTQINAILASSDPAYDKVIADIISVSIGDNECGHWGYPPGDISRDCVVDIQDLLEMAFYWLACSMPDTEGCVSF